MISGTRVLIGAIAALAFTSISANAQLFGPTGLDPSFCQKKTFRNTVVYIDDKMMRDGETAWANTIADKLRATLIPGERVTVVQLSPEQARSQQIWTACWPDYTNQEREQIAKENHFFSGDPVGNIKKQQAFFLAELGSALGKIYEATKQKPAERPRKAIVEALASDGARFSQSPTTTRAIVYSDLAENSDIGSVANKTPAPEDVGKRLGTQLRQTVFYFFGVGASKEGGPGYLQSAKQFWIPVMASMDAAVAGFSSDLNVPNLIPVTGYQYGVTLDRSGQPLSGRASVLATADGDLVDSWIGVSRLTFASINGTFQCSKAGTGDCTLTATTTSGLATNNQSETIELSGNDPDELKGTVGVKGALTFPLALKASR